MSIFNCCTCRNGCTAAAVLVSAVAGILAAFLQVTGTIAVSTVFLWVAFAVGVVYLAVLAAAAALARQTAPADCLCGAVNALLVGILAAVTLAVVLLATGTAAGGVITAILVGALVFSLSLTLTATACFIRCLLGCEG